MFDHIGKDPDEEANRRRATSLLLTIIGFGGAIGFSIGLAAYTAVEVLLEDPFDDEMIEVVMEDIEMDDAPPPPPPPPPPPAAAAADEPEEEEEPDDPQPDEMDEEIEELDEKVEEEIKSDVKPAGVVGGVEGGQVGGVVGGVLGGVEGGVLGGQLGGVRVFHHSELEVKRRSDPVYPKSAKELNLGNQRCIAKVFIDEKGVPYDVMVEDCPKVFHSATKEAILKWRWYPPRAGKTKTKAQTTIGITYKLK